MLFKEGRHKGSFHLFSLNGVLDSSRAAADVAHFGTTVNAHREGKALVVAELVHVIDYFFLTSNQATT